MSALVLLAEGTIHDTSVMSLGVLSTPPAYVCIYTCRAVQIEHRIVISPAVSFGEEINRSKITLHCVINIVRCPVGVVVLVVVQGVSTFFFVLRHNNGMAVSVHKFLYCILLMSFYVVVLPRGQVQHTPSLLPGLVTCTVGGGEGRNKLRRATVQLPNTATFRELLTSAREQRYGAHEFEGPVYGGDGELETILVDAWVRNGCKIDGTRHIGIAVVVSLPVGSQLPLNLTMGPGDTINDVKQVGFGFTHRVLCLACRN